MSKKKITVKTIIENLKMTGGRVGWKDSIGRIIICIYKDKKYKFKIKKYHKVESDGITEDEM